MSTIEIKSARDLLKHMRYWLVKSKDEAKSLREREAAEQKILEPVVCWKVVIFTVQRGSNTECGKPFTIIAKLVGAGWFNADNEIALAVDETYKGISVLDLKKGQKLLVTAKPHSCTIGSTSNFLNLDDREFNAIPLRLEAVNIALA